MRRPTGAGRRLSSQRPEEDQRGDHRRRPRSRCARPRGRTTATTDQRPGGQGAERDERVHGRRAVAEVRAPRLGGTASRPRTRPASRARARPTPSRRTRAPAPSRAAATRNGERDPRGEPQAERRVARGWLGRPDRGVVSRVLDRRDELGGVDTAGVVDDRRLLRRVVDRRLDAVELVQPPLDAGGARRRTSSPGSSRARFARSRSYYKGVYRPSECLRGSRPATAVASARRAPLARPAGPPSSTTSSPEAGENALEAAKKAEARFREFPNAPVAQADIKRLEHVGDRITHDLIQLLNTQYVTPFDREDIYELATALDDVVDHIEEASRPPRALRRRDDARQAIEQCRILVGAVEHLAAALGRAEGRAGASRASSSS